MTSRNVRLIFLQTAISLVSLYLTGAVASSSPTSVNTLPGGAVIEFQGKLSGLKKRKFGDGWASASLKTSTGKRIPLFPEEQLNQMGGMLFEDFYSTQVSPSGNYVILSVVRQGTLETKGEAPRVEGREYCPVIKTATGCIVSMPTGEVCGGAWASHGDNWLIGETDRTAEMLKRTTASAESLWNDFSRSDKRVGIREFISQDFGISNLLACDSPSPRNGDNYLSIVRQLRKEGAVDDALYIETRLPLSKNASSMRVSVSKAWLYDTPDLGARTKAYLVLGDVVSLQDEKQSGWVLIEYHRSGGRPIVKWILESDLVAD
ncbi:hypothetical protein AWB74_02359 [Caballeronia arvi]|uniref:SH3 domain-containing protein n=1 Tax=Caballeronia arvi TaxID=1777135 RepID=A0A158I3K3_9BURK|nr:hypothetical protein [Caballeronia arvi]SAL51182.1 hypothetical protein AWB74_02359 [Caballeronia arvi]